MLWLKNHRWLDQAVPCRCGCRYRPFCSTGLWRVSVCDERGDVMADGGGGRKSSSARPTTSVLPCIVQERVLRTHVVQHTGVDVVGLPSSVCVKVVMRAIPVLDGKGPPTSISIFLPTHNLQLYMCYSMLSMMYDGNGKKTTDIPLERET
jgi:hypothetical protein